MLLGHEKDVNSYTDHCKMIFAVIGLLEGQSVLISLTNELTSVFSNLSWKKKLLIKNERVLRKQYGISLF